MANSRISESEKATLRRIGFSLGLKPSQIEEAIRKAERGEITIGPETPVNIYRDLTVRFGFDPHYAGTLLGVDPTKFAAELSQYEPSPRGSFIRNVVEYAKHYATKPLRTFGLDVQVGSPEAKTGWEKFLGQLMVDLPAFAAITALTGGVGTLPLIGRMGLEAAIGGAYGALFPSGERPTSRDIFENMAFFGSGPLVSAWLGKLFRRIPVGKRIPVQEPVEKRVVIPEPQAALVPVRQHVRTHPIPEVPVGISPFSPQTPRSTPVLPVGAVPTPKYRIPVRQVARPAEVPVQAWMPQAERTARTTIRAQTEAPEWWKVARSEVGRRPVLTEIDIIERSGPQSFVSSRISETHRIIRSVDPKIDPRTIDAVVNSFKLDLTPKPETVLPSVIFVHAVSEDLQRAKDIVRRLQATPQGWSADTDMIRSVLEEDAVPFEMIGEFIDISTGEWK